MITYDSEFKYVNTAATLQERIANIETIIDGLLTAAEQSVGKEYIEEYSLNDGQTQIRTRYRGTEAITQSIKQWEAIKQIYVNRLNGRVKRLMDSQNFTGRSC